MMIDLIQKTSVSVTVTDKNGKYEKRTLFIPKGSVLNEVLLENGIENSSVCGGKMCCGGCAVKVNKGNFPPPSEEEQMLLECIEGEDVRLGCQLMLYSSADIEIVFLNSSSDK